MAKKTEPASSPGGVLLPVDDDVQVTSPQGLIRLAEAVAAVVKFPGRPVPVSFLDRLDKAVAAVRAEASAPLLLGELLSGEADPRVAERAAEVEALTVRVAALEALLAGDGPVAEKLQELKARVDAVAPAQA